MRLPVAKSPVISLFARALRMDCRRLFSYTRRSAALCLALRSHAVE